MKKIILVFALLLSLTAVAQVNFPWQKPEILIGKEVRVKPIKLSSFEKGYSDFFADEQLKQHYLAKEGEAYYSPVEPLVEHVFKVIGVDPIPGKKYMARLKLLDEAKGETFFYSYSKEIETFFVLEVAGGLTFPEGYFCDYIVPAQGVPEEKHVMTTEISGIELKKSVKKSPKPVITYTMHIKIDSKQRCDTDNKEALILLGNDKMISTGQAMMSGKPYSDNNLTYHYDVFFNPTKAEVELLKTNPIIGVKVQQAEKTVSAGDSTILMNMFNCLINKQIK